MFWRYVLLFLGVFACSTAVLWIKMSHAQPCVLVALRLCLASLLLAPVAWRDFKRHSNFGAAQIWRRTFWPSIMLAAHFISWTYGARMTLAAQATLIVNLVPVAMPFALHWLLREKINRAEILGTILALVGLVVLTYKDAMSGAGDFWGNLVCFASLLVFTGYLALGRKNRDFPSIWLYVVPVYFQAGILCLLISLPWIRGFPFQSPREVGLIALLAIIPTIIGHTLINLSMRSFRGQAVSLFNGAQFLFAGFLAYFFFHEKPVGDFYPAAVLIVAGMATVILRSPPQPRLR